jgi:hypothetical protein
MFFIAREVPICALYTAISCGGDRSGGVTDNAFFLSFSTFFLLEGIWT